MTRLDLNGQWRMRPQGSGDWIAAKVPGSVYQDLLAAGKTEDAYLRDNETRVQELFTKNYEYALTFELDGSMLDHRRVVLSCQGLDTLATVFLNGKEAGRSDNMHRPWIFEVKSLLTAGTNEIRILFASPVTYQDPSPSILPISMFPNSLRKAHCMFGWDWGLTLPDMGIWRGISLDCYDEGHIKDLYVRQIHGADGAVSLEIEVESEIAGEGLEAEAVVEGPILGEKPGKNVYSAREPARDVQRFTTTVEDPALWWPAGQGDQPLYRVRVSLRGKAGVVDTCERMVGLRTIRLLREDDEYGRGYAFVVNGRKIFAKGANLVIEDAVLGRRSKERTARMIADCVAANFNCIRVWGGANYPEDYFYDLCDRFGILVYQDFMFACSMYPVDEGFIANIREEAAHALRSLRNHPSLALWCGNNEIEIVYHFFDENSPFADLVASFGIKKIPQEILDLYRTNTMKLFYEVLPALVSALDRERDYVPSSPSSDVPFETAGFDQVPRGDSHYYLVYDQLRPYPDIRKLRFRFVSEMGFQSYPDWKTVLSFTSPEDRGPYTPVMLQHQKCRDGNKSIEHYIQQDYRVPTDFRDYVYASQLMAGQIMGYSVEHFRRLTGLCMGVITWQLSDCWPVVSWAGLDYYGRWKAQQYFLKRAFAPVMISALDEGTAVTLYVNNDRPQSFRGSAAWTLYDRAFSAVKSGETAIVVEPQAAFQIKLPDFSAYIPHGKEGEYVLSYSVSENGVCLSEGNLLFVKPKDYLFAEPAVEVAVRESAEVFTLDVFSKVFVRGMELYFEEVDALFSDNYFDLLPGKHKVLEIPKARLTAALDAASLRRELRWKTAYDLQRAGDSQ